MMTVAGKIVQRVKRFYMHRSIQFTIAISFTVASIACMAVLGITLYVNFTAQIEVNKISSMEQVLNQTSINLETYLRNMMRISDSLYYSVIKDMDISVDRMDDELALLYEANKDNLVSIVCFTASGELVSATPITGMKPGLDVSDQDWFIKASQKMENLHFSNPHVQNLFDDMDYRHYWVVTLSRMVELTQKGKIERGILVVDMNYSSIEQMFNRINSNQTINYVYLTDGDGNIIYHPKQMLIHSGLYGENNTVAASYDDGSHDEIFENERRIVTVKTVGYTGWKIISVTPESALRMGLNTTQYYMMLIILFMINFIIIINQFISLKIAKPIKTLENSMRGLENGNLDTDIYIGGSYEIRHLGTTIESVVAQLRQLMHDIVIEQEDKSRNEMDALQSQINPHFLYNTLDSIIWMIESARYEEAIFMISELASLFRVSLSKGKTVISIEDELKHAQNYLSIQKIRYKNKFCTKFMIDPAIHGYSTVKLIIQPILENAIYYGMEYADGDGEIIVKGYKEQEDIYIEISDNGLGMPAEVVDNLLKDNNRVKRRGSGVGLINVHKRIGLYFGSEYGLHFESVPDEGTTVTIHLPARIYEEDLTAEGGGGHET